MAKNKYQKFLLDEIEPALRAIDLFSENAAQLLLGTAIVESALKYREQLGGGPALGFFQMEPNTHNDIWNNYLKYRKPLRDKLTLLLTSDDKLNELKLNDKYGAAMARIHYKRVSESIPNLNDIPTMSKYWKKYYNVSGKRPAEDYVIEWKNAMGNKLIYVENTPLQNGEHIPSKSETSTVGPLAKKITRNSPEFNKLVKNTNPDIVFKNEEGTDADRYMTKKVSSKLNALSVEVHKYWNSVKLRVTEAWDENNEHSINSLHYEGRSVDLTTFPVKNDRLGMLGRLAVNVGFEWVYYEGNHIHASMSA